jgi:hypothetical protein
MTHTGKIGRLPQARHDQLGQRLEDGCTGIEIVDWLNEQPDVRRVLSDHFGGRPITEQNLSDWRQSGHIERLHREEARQAMANLADQADDVQDLVGACRLADEFALVVLAQIHRLSRLLLSDEGDLETRWKRLREINRELAQLHQQDHAAARLRMAEGQWRWKFKLEQEAEVRNIARRERIKAVMAKDWRTPAEKALAERQAGPTAPAPEGSKDQDLLREQTRALARLLAADPELEPATPLAEPEAMPEETPFTPPPGGKRAIKSKQSPEIQVNRGESCSEEAE